MIERSEVLRLHHDAVGGLEEVAGRVSEWERPACGHWSAADTVRHVLAVVDWYHDWLDRALAGTTMRPFPHEEMAQRNQDEVDSRAGVGPLAAIERFDERARDYADRVDEHWDLPFAFPFGDVTAGLHLGVAATEWNLHAWDLSGELAERHVPADPGGLYRAASACVARARGGVVGRLIGLAAPIVPAGRAWPLILQRSGRSPDGGPADGRSGRSPKAGG